MLILVIDVFKFPDKPPNRGDETNMLRRNFLQQSLYGNSLRNKVLQNEIHLVCFVNGMTEFDTLVKELTEEFQEIQTKVNKKGVPMVVLATKFDNVCQEVKKDATNVYTSRKALEAVEKISNFFGVDMSLTFPVVNNVDDSEQTVDKDPLALHAVREMVSLIEDHLESVTATHRKMHRGSEFRQMMFGMLREETTFRIGKPLRIVCVGPVNSGKTYFIDSLASALRGEIVELATLGISVGGLSEEEREESLTEKFEMFMMQYKDKSEQIQNSNVFIGDTPGFQASDGVSVKDIEYVIKGRIRNKYKIKNGVGPCSELSNSKELGGDKAHCVCFVFDISTPPDRLPDRLNKMIKSVQLFLAKEAIPYVVVLTKADKLGNELKEHRINVFQDKTANELIKKFQEVFGFKETKMFPVMNYIDETDVVPEKDNLLIAAFWEMLKQGKLAVKKQIEDEDDEHCKASMDDGEQNKVITEEL